MSTNNHPQPQPATDQTPPQVANDTTAALRQLIATANRQFTNPFAAIRSISIGLRQPSDDHARRGGQSVDVKIYANEARTNEEEEEEEEEEEVNAELEALRESSNEKDRRLNELEAQIADLEEELSRYRSAANNGKDDDDSEEEEEGEEEEGEGEGEEGEEGEGGEGEKGGEGEEGDGDDAEVEGSQAPTRGKLEKGSGVYKSYEYKPRGPEKPVSDPEKIMRENRRLSKASATPNAAARKPAAGGTMAAPSGETSATRPVRKRPSASTKASGSMEGMIDEADDDDQDVGGRPKTGSKTAKKRKADTSDGEEQAATGKKTKRTATVQTVDEELDEDDFAEVAKSRGHGTKRKGA